MEDLKHIIAGEISIPSGRLAVVDPLYAGEAIEDGLQISTPLKVGDVVENSYIVVETPARAKVIFSECEDTRRTMMVTLDFRDGDGEALIQEGLEFSHKLPVDVAQLIFVDADFLDADWEEQEYEDVRIYRHKGDGRTLQYGVDFNSYEAKIPTEGNATMNALNKSGEWEAVPYTPSSTRLGYNTVGHATGNNKMLLSEFAAAARTGWGDGLYPVYIERDGEGKVSRMSFDFDGLNAVWDEDRDGEEE